jgi:hypothetical protein
MREREREPDYTSGSYLAALVCSIVLFLLGTAHVKRTGRLPFQPAPPFRATADDAASEKSPLERAVARGEAIYREPAYPPATDIVVVGPRGPDGRIIPLVYESRGGAIIALPGEQGDVAGMPGRPDEVVTTDPYTARPHEAAMDSKSFDELIRDVRSRLVGANRQYP